MICLSSISERHFKTILQFTGHYTAASGAAVILELYLKISAVWTLINPLFSVSCPVYGLSLKGIKLGDSNSILGMNSQNQIPLGFKALKSQEVQTHVRGLVFAKSFDSDPFNIMPKLKHSHLLFVGTANGPHTTCKNENHTQLLQTSFFSCTSGKESFHAILIWSSTTQTCEKKLHL